MSHAGYLRDFWAGDDADFLAVIRGLHRAAAEADALPARAGPAHVAGVIEGLPGLDAADRAILIFVTRLTLRPRGMSAAALTPLRGIGLSDRLIHDVVHVACCFAYMNRLADGTGVALTGRREAFAEELLGAEALAAHRAWSAPMPPPTGR